MHICGMDFSSLASYWQIKALLMLEPSVVTPQNQYFPANADRMAVHYWEIHPAFLRAGILLPLALEMQNSCPWEISWCLEEVFPNMSLLSAVFGYILCYLLQLLISLLLLLMKTLPLTTTILTTMFMIEKFQSESFFQKLHILTFSQPIVPGTFFRYNIVLSSGF